VENVFSISINDVDSFSVPGINTPTLKLASQFIVACIQESKSTTQNGKTTTNTVSAEALTIFQWKPRGLSF
jgi:hypothetical protein